MTPPDPSCADSDDRDQATLRFYDDQAAVYAAHAPDQASRHLAGFLSRLTASARILELGCGGGRDSRAMLDQGFDLDPTDGSPAIAREASARLGRPVRVLRFDQLDAVAAYDGVWAHASLLHVPRAGLAGVLARIFQALKPGGLYVILDHQAADGAGISVAGTLHRIEAAELRRQVEAAGFIFDGETSAVRVPADDHSLSVFDASIRGRTDRFVYRFRKPG